MAGRWGRGRRAGGEALPVSTKTGEGLLCSVGVGVGVKVVGGGLPWERVGSYTLVPCPQAKLHCERLG